MPSEAKSKETAAEGRHGYSAERERLLKRLRRAEGQIRGVERMVEEDRYCIDVITQISAVQAALDKVALGLLEDHTRHCVIEGRAEGRPDQLTEEIMTSVSRLLHRR